jgi:hypothetical protein
MGFFSNDELRDKLIVLYVISETGLLLTEEQLLHILVRQGWMEYFPFAHALGGLRESGFVAMESRPIGSCLTLTSSGQEAIDVFANRIPASIRKQIDEFIAEQKPRIAMHTQHQASYRKIKPDAFLVELSIADDENTLMDLSLDVPSAEMARSFCARWPERAQRIYAQLITELGGGHWRD